MIKLLNVTIKRAKENTKCGLKQHNLQRKNLKIVAFLDSTFADCADVNTHLYYVMLLMDGSRHISWLSYKSYKCSRVVMSVLVGETYALAGCFGTAYSIRHDLKDIAGYNILTTMLTDLKSLF